MKVSIYIFFAALIMISCNKDEEKEVFYIPQDYTGAVAIVFDQKNGVPKEYKEDTRIYRIPESGVLYTQFPIVGNGLLHQKFYYIKSSEETVELSSLFLPLLSSSKYDSTHAYALRGFDGGFEKGNGGKVKYIYFCVGKASQSDSLTRAAHKFMDRVREIYPEQIK